MLRLGPATPIGRIDLLTDDERHLALNRWNATATETEPTTLPVLFARQVARTPDRVAVSDDRTSRTFSELGTRVERLARVLAQRGVRDGRIVAVALPRSVDTITVLLAHRARRGRLEDGRRVTTVR